MKFRRFLSGLIFAAGCILLFISLLAYVLSYASLPQLEVLRDSFYSQSDHAVIDLINRFMRLAIAQHWQTAAAGILLTAAGIVLMNHFSRARKAMRQSVIEENPAPSTAPCDAEETVRIHEKNNPFAVDVYNQRMKDQADSKPAFELPSTPILERNAIEEVPLPQSIPEPENNDPYFSPRFPFESRAVETEAETPSPSGSWILKRTPVEMEDPPAFTELSMEPESEPLPAPEPELPAETLPPFENPEPVPAPPEGMPTLRIRSTMGRHGNRKTNFRQARS